MPSRTAVLPKGWTDSGETTAASRVPRFHAHGCTRCRRRYMDSCKAKLENGLCTPCRTGAEPVEWDAARFPAECCQRPNGCRRVYDDDIERYSLGGPGPWFICATCARTHPTNPSGNGTGAST